MLSVAIFKCHFELFVRIQFNWEESMEMKPPTGTSRNRGAENFWSSGPVILFVFLDFVALNFINLKLYSIILSGFTKLSS